MKRIAIGTNNLITITLDTATDRNYYVVRIWDLFHPENDQITTFDSMAFSYRHFFLACRENGIEPVKANIMI